MVGLEQQGNVYIFIHTFSVQSAYNIHKNSHPIWIHFMFQAHADTATLIMKNVYTPPLEVFIIYTFYVSGPC